MLSVASHSDDQVDAAFSSSRAALLMQSDGFAAQFQHLASHQDAPLGGHGGKGSDHGLERFGIGVVTIVDNRGFRDTQHLAARSFKTKVEERLTALHNRLVFFDLWWQSVDKDNARRLMTGTGTLRYHLETIRRFKSHTLSEPEEKIINIKNVTGRSAVHSLYDVVTNGFTFTLTVKGKRKTMTREELTSYLRHAQKAWRADFEHPPAEQVRRRLTFREFCGPLAKMFG